MATKRTLQARAGKPSNPPPPTPPADPPEDGAPHGGKRERRGGARPNAGRKPSEALDQKARLLYNEDDCEEAYNALMNLVRSPDHEDHLNAVKVRLDFGFGKAHTTSNVKVEKIEPLQVAYPPGWKPPDWKALPAPASNSKLKLAKE